ncbi:MAG: HlyD family efflux transporter periplasmic adaptor subunit [Melioribacteraceae bacterium]|nr:HlyD family efflux transporter periplasmic adaptor subunit [Melioribacteraceae bacterium]
MFNKRSLVIIGSIAFLIVCSLLMYASLAAMKPEVPTRPHTEVIRSVKAATIKYTDLSTSIIKDGRVSSKEEIILASEVSGKILKGDVDLKEGIGFKKGDILFNIYKKEAVLGLKSKKSLFLNRLAGILPDFKIDYSESYEKWYNFFDSIKIDEDIPELPIISSVKEKVFLSSRNILSDFYSIQSEELRIKKYSIIAPFDGTFSELSMEVGAIANTGSKIGMIINTGNMELEVPVEYKDISWIKEGQKVHIKNEAQTKVLEGKVDRIGQNIDPTNQMISVYVSLKAPSDSPIYKGEYFKAKFGEIILSGVMELPRTAVFNNDEVFLVKENKLVKAVINKVKINEKTLFFNGLEEDVDIVTEPLINADENNKVNILR